MNARLSTPDRATLRNFGLVTGTLTAVLFGALAPWLRARPYPLWPWIVAAILGLWALAWPTTLTPVYRVWMKVGHYLGWLNTSILLSVVFYALIAPMGFIMRLVRQDPMRRGFDKSLASYRVPTAVRSNRHLERPF
jgi:hypothetical protein